MAWFWVKILFDHKTASLTSKGNSVLGGDHPLWKTKNKHVSFLLAPTHGLLPHSGIYGHKNETQILEIVAFIVQFYTYFNTYDMN